MVILYLLVVKFLLVDEDFNEDYVIENVQVFVFDVCIVLIFFEVCQSNLISFCIYRGKCGFLYIIVKVMFLDGVELFFYWGFDEDGFLIRCYVDLRYYDRLVELIVLDGYVWLGWCVIIEIDEEYDIDILVLLNFFSEEQVVEIGFKIRVKIRMFLCIVMLEFGYIGFWKMFWDGLKIEVKIVGVLLWDFFYKCFLELWD